MKHKSKKRKAEGQYLQLAVVENDSGWQVSPIEQIPPLRKGYYQIVDVSPGGDAPKDFIQLYEYGKARRSNPRKWQAWIAKVGHKWHPIESIMEYMLNRLGESMGLNMAKSRLMRTGTQIRFLSKYFLHPNEQLIHGAEIYGGYLSDQNMVEQIEKEGLARELLTFQFAEKAFKQRFPKYATQLLEGFVRMLVFDTIVGNNDRHFYNWGIITLLDGSKPPRFAPIYDTARGLFWNDTERKLLEKLNKPSDLNVYLEKYVRNSLPKTGWEGESNINHFGLFEKLKNWDSKYLAICAELCSAVNEQKAMQLLDSEFSTLISPQRLHLIKRCLGLRFQHLRTILSKSSTTV